MRVHELHYWLLHHGWVWEYTNGSHRHYRHKETGKRFHFAAHGRNPTLRPAQIAHIVRDLEKLGIVPNSSKRL